MGRERERVREIIWRVVVCMGGREGGRESSPTLQLTARDVRTEMIASHRPAPKYCTLLGPGVFYTYLLQVP